MSFSNTMKTKVLAILGKTFSVIKGVNGNIWQSTCDTVFFHTLNYINDFPFLLSPPLAIPNGLRKI